MVPLRIGHVGYEEVYQYIELLRMAGIVETIFSREAIVSTY
jgi:hypothetical protein